MVSSLESEQFVSRAVQWAPVANSIIAYRRFGKGDPLVLLHGWPLSSTTFRKLVPLLQDQFDCCVPDLPGCGQSEWSSKTDFSIAGRAQTIATFARNLGLQSYFLVAHNTGATIARALALSEGDRVRRFAILNTEIPFHRPPWIPLYRLLLFLPGSNLLFRQLIRSRRFVHSSMGFGNCFYNRTLLEGDFWELVVHPLLKSRRAMEGQARAIRGIEWSFLDALAKSHQRIKVPVLLIWGEDDPTFPIQFAREMATQFSNCYGVRAVSRTKLLLHEEAPKAVAALLSEFFHADLSEDGQAKDWR